MLRALKRSAWLLAALCLFVVTLGAALWLAGNTDSGRALIERLTYRLTAGHVRLSGLGGAFPTRPTLEELQLSDSRGVWLTADRLSLHWSPVQLLARRIQVDELQVARLHMERAPSGGGQGGSVSVPHIDVVQFAIERVELGAPLVGTPATVSLRGGLQLRSLTDATADVVARRVDGNGDYTLHLGFDPKQMDATLAVHEPASGPLENLLSLPGLGALSATLSIQGPRNAERVAVVLNAGEARGRVQGSVDLVHRSADLDYSLAAPAMAPRPDLAWARVALQGNWHGSFAAPTAAGKLAVDGLRIAGKTSMSRLSADLAASGGKLAVHSLIDGLEIPGTQPRLLANEPLKIDAFLMLNEASRPLQLTASDSLFTLRANAETAAEKSGQRRATIELRVAELAPFAAYAGQDVHGNATINARLAYGRGSSTAVLDGNVGLTGAAAGWIQALGPRVGFNLSGTLGDDSMKLQSLRLAGNSATLTASGSATRAAGAATGFIKDLQVRWQLEVADLSLISSDLAGDLKMSGQLSGAPNAMLADAGVVSRLSVRGSASGPVAVAVHARGLPNSPSGTIQAHGMIDGAPLSLDAALERSGSNDFRALVRRAEWKSARMEGDLTTNAQLTQSRGQLRLHIGQLGDFDRLLGVRVDGSVQGDLGFEPAHGHTQARLELDGRNLIMGPLAGDAHLQGSGVADSFGLQLTAQLPKFYGMPARLTSAASLNIAARELRIASASADYRGETFRLLSAAQLSFSNGLSINARIGAQEAVFELAGRLAPTLDMHASLLQVNPGLVNVFMPGLLAHGTIEAQARLQGSPSSLNGNVQVDAGNVLFADEAATGLPPVNIHAEAQLAGDTALLKATLTAGSASQFAVSGSAPLTAGGALDMKIGGKLDVGLANPFLEARGLHAAGRLSVDATVTGDSRAPQIGGVVTLGQGSLRDYGRGVTLSEINAEVVGDAAGLQIKSFIAKAGSGTVAMTGTFGVLQHGMPVDLRITAKNAQPVASSVLTANLDADLHVSGTALERIDVAGTIHVNRANVGIPDSLPPEVAVLDVRRRGRAAPLPSGKQLIVGIEVAIQAPQEILVQGRGLDAELGGEIKLSGTTEDLLASGGFELQRGSFGIAGNKLNFTQGRVGFDGEGLRKKIDPTLDFTAQTTVTDTTITLRITGFADGPRFEFSSTPALPQDEIMARLFFGESADKLSALQVAQIGAALATLSGVGGSSNPLVKLQRSLGLDRLSVGANTTNTPTGTESSGAAIAAGRYVSKRIYIEGKQSTTGSSQVQVDVDLTKHLKLQTRLGNGTATTQGTTPENDPGSSIGISYQFEY